MGEMILWGATGQARVLRESMPEHSLVALFDENPALDSPFADVPLVGGRDAFDNWLTTRAAPAPGFLVAIGGQHGRVRVEIQKRLETAGLPALVALHRTAFVARSATIGAGSQVLAQTAVCVDARIGRGCIVNTGATIDHECVLGNGVHVAPGAHIAGCVQLDDFATVFTGASIGPGVHVGEGAIIGAGTVVLSDVPAHTFYAGNPGRIIKTLHGDDADDE